MEILTALVFCNLWKLNWLNVMRRISGGRPNAPEDGSLSLLEGASVAKLEPDYSRQGSIIEGKASEPRTVLERSEIYTTIRDFRE